MNNTERKYTRMPFDLDLSKKIDAKFCTGRVVIGLRDAKPYAGADYIGHPYEVKIFDYESKRVPNKPIAYVILDLDRVGYSDGSDLYIELPEAKFKIGDHVLIHSGNKEFNGKTGVVMLVVPNDNPSENAYVLQYNGGIYGSYMALEKQLEAYNPDDTGVFDAYDKVLVRNKDNEGWMARLYDIYLVGLGHGCQDGRVYSQCIKYNGNEDLLGTTRSK